MPVAAAVGETLVGLDALDAVADTRRDEIESFIDKPHVDRAFGNCRQRRRHRVR